MNRKATIAESANIVRGNPEQYSHLYDLGTILDDGAYLVGKNPSYEECQIRDTAVGAQLCKLEYLFFRDEKPKILAHHYKEVNPKLSGSLTTYARYITYYLILNPEQHVLLELTKGQ